MLPLFTFVPQPLIDLSVLPLDNSALLMDSSQSPLTQLLPADQSNTTQPFHTSLHSTQPEQSMAATPHTLVPLTVAGGVSGPAISLDAGAQPVSSTTLALPDLPRLHSKLTAFHSAVGSLVQRYATMVSENFVRYFFS